MNNPNIFPADHPSGVARCEAALLGSVVLDPTCLPRVAPLVRADDFQDPGYAALFAALQTLADARKPIADAAWLLAELPRWNVPAELCTPAALAKLIHAAVHAGHAVFYAEQVAEAAALRRLLALAGDLQRRAAEPDADAEDVSAWLESRFASLNRVQPDDMPEVGEIGAKLLADLDARAKAEGEAQGRGLFTGIEALDERVGPTMPGEVVVIAARTGKGKTSLGTQIAEHNARKGHASLIVSLEMEGAELTERMLAGLAGIDGRKLRSSNIDGHARQLLADAHRDIARIPLRIWSPPRATFADIRGAARYRHATTGLKLLVVDYVQFVAPAPDEKRLLRHEQIGLVTFGLKSLAKELGIVVFLLAQLHRDADGEEPKLSHLRESGSIEQDADAVWLIHDPPTTASTVGGSIAAKAVTLIVGKHRHGEVGKTSLLWYPKETRFASPRTAQF